MFPHERASLDELTARAEAELGIAFADSHSVGQAIGRSDGIATALWPDEAEPRQLGVASDWPLTARECEVAELVTEGLTNRQIAGRRLSPSAPSTPMSRGYSPSSAARAGAGRRDRRDQPQIREPGLAGLIRARE